MVSKGRKAGPGVTDTYQFLRGFAWGEGGRGEGQGSTQRAQATGTSVTFLKMQTSEINMVKRIR